MKAEQIIAEAKSWIGTNYHHQGRLKRSSSCKGGVDCIGLIMGVAKELNLVSKTGSLIMEHDAIDYTPYPDGIRLKAFLDTHMIYIDKNDVEPGDVLLFKFFTDPQHLAMASDYFEENLSIIHSYSSSDQVVEHILSASWQRMLICGYRFADFGYITDRSVPSNI